MAHYRRRDALEIRVADRLEVNGRSFTADLIAKRATGVKGYRMTLAFLEIDGEGSFFVDLDPAPSRQEATGRGESLAADPDELKEKLRARISDQGADGG